MHELWIQRVLSDRKQIMHPVHAIPSMGRTDIQTFAASRAHIGSVFTMSFPLPLSLLIAFESKRKMTLMNRKQR